MAFGRRLISEWPDPLTNQRLAVVLRELAVLTAGDPSYDFGTLCHQVLRAVSASIPKTSTWLSDLVVVNRHLYTIRHRLDSKAAGEVLPELFKGAADQIETRPSEETVSEVNDA